MDHKPYHYYAKVVSIYDADTLRLDVSLGFGLWKKNEPIRLFGINAPEVRGKERAKGLESKAFLQQLLPVNSDVILETKKDKKGKYGRYLGIIWYKTSDGLLASANSTLVHEGYAEFKDY